MASKLYHVYWVVEETGCSCVFEGEDGGSSAMKFAMDLERLDYTAKVTKETIGNQNTNETVYESDDWQPIAVQTGRMEAA